MRLADNLGREITYRYVRPEDDIDLITGMLHEAYRPLAAQGLRFLATHQDAATTRRRMSRGETILAFDADQIVGTITLKDVENTKVLLFTTALMSPASASSRFGPPTRIPASDRAC